MRCAGSVGEGGEASVHAALGTFAHDIAARCLNDQSLSPSDFLAQKATIDGHEVECDLEMIDGVRLYLDTLDADLQEGDMTWVEMPLREELQTVDRDLGGTSDYVRYRPATQELLTADLKYGAGKYVEVVDNEQLRLYALGALLKVQRMGLKVKTCRSMVVQPRYEGAAPVREETFQAVDLLAFAADVQEACDRTRLPNPPLVAGDHCKFCVKSRTCKELERRHHAMIALNDLAVVPAEAVGAALADIPLLKERIRAIEEHAYKLACQGIEIPGHKLVDKLPRRKWKREGDVIEWAQTNALDPYAPREILSPAQLEEKVKAAAPRGKKKEAAKVLEQFVERVSSGTALVPITDDRPAVAVKRVGENDFAAVGGDAKPAAPAALINLF